MEEVTLTIDGSQDSELQTLDLLAQVMARFSKTPGPRCEENYEREKRRIAWWFHDRYGKLRPVAVRAVE